MLFNKIIELTEKPAQVAAQRWWSSKETTTITANGPATTLGSPWPTAEPSKEKWSSDGAGGLQLGKASITLGELQGIDVPVFCLNYEGLGQVLRGAFAMPDILQQLGASLHAMFDKSIPTEGVKTWIANTGWHKNPQGKGYPAEFEVFFSTVLDIPQMEGGPAPFMLKRSSDGTLCFRSLRSEMLRSTLDVRSSEPGDRQFLEQVRQVAGIATKAFSAATASDGPFNKEQVALQMAFKTDPQAPAEEILAATKKWIEDVDAFIDSHPTITALREKTAPMVEAINAYLPAEPSPAAADPVSQRRPRAR